MKRAAPYNRDVALQAAMELFWKKGYHATSLKNLEDALRMKAGSLYAAFKSKENLFLLTLDRYHDIHEREFGALVSKSDRAWEALKSILLKAAEGNAECAEQQFCMATKTMLNITDDNPKIAARSRENLNKMRDAFAEAFQIAKNQGDIAQDADIEQLAVRYQAYLTAIKTEVYRGTDPAHVKEMAKGFAADLFRSIV